MDTDTLGGGLHKKYYLEVFVASEFIISRMCRKTNSLAIKDKCINNIKLYDCLLLTA